MSPVMKGIAIAGAIVLCYCGVFGFVAFKPHTRAPQKLSVTTPPVSASLPDGLDPDQLFEKKLESLGLDPSKEYPYWPLVYGPHKQIGDYLVGEVRNYSDSAVHGLRIKFSLYNSDGFKIGETFDSLGSLDGGETWKYSAPIRGVVMGSKGPEIYSRGIMGDPRYK